MNIPADIPPSKKEIFSKNMHTITRGTNHIFMFAGDQKIEHLNDDFYGKDIHLDAAKPEHLFNIAQQGDIGAFATQLGLIARYGSHYNTVNYIAKLNSKTNISSAEPLSTQLWSIEDVLHLKENGHLNIIGVGYTIYLGSAHEAIMLQEAAQIIQHAHQHGLLAIIWIYPRGKDVHEDTTLAMLAGAAGVANALGADIVKIKKPSHQNESTFLEQLNIIQQAAGNTKVIYSGGEKIDHDQFIKLIKLMIKEGKSNGIAVGRNIFQQSLSDAIAMTKELAHIIYN